MSGPGAGERPGDDVATVAALGAADTAAPAAAPEDRGGVWPGRVTLSARQRAGICVAAVVIAGYFLTLLTLAADWAQHPGLASLTAVASTAGVAALVASAWARRPVFVRAQPLPRLPRAVRRDLERELRAGHPGPHELRPYAARWTVQHLQMPWFPALFLLIIANTGGFLTYTEPTSIWLLVLMAVVVVCCLPAVVLWTFWRRPAHRVADALDQDTPPPPPLPPDPA